MLNPAKRKRPPAVKKGKARAVETIDEFGLTPRQRRFADQYLIDENASAAYIKAGYTAKNENVAAANASRMIRLDKVAAYIAARVKSVSDRCGITLERTLRHVANMGYVDPRKFLNDDGSLVPLKELDDESAGALAGFEVVVEAHQKGAPPELQPAVTTKIKLDKLGALDKLMRFHGAYKDKMEHSGEGGGPIVYRMDKLDEAA